MQGGGGVVRKEQKGKGKQDKQTALSTGPNAGQYQDPEIMS